MAMSTNRVITASVMGSATFALLVAYIVLRVTTPQCDTPAYISGFNQNSYLGRWYEI